MKQRFLVGAAIVAILLIGGEIAARFVLPRVPSSDDIGRNPYRFRGWPEYVSAPRGASSSAKLVLLTNSQGYSGELSHTTIYPVRLEALLTGAHAGGRDAWDVLNWSSDGMTSIELMLLAAHLHERHVDVVLAVTGYADYAAEHSRNGFLYCRSDIPRLGTRSGIVRRVPRTYWERHFKCEDWLTMFLRDRVALTRLREYGWSWFEVRMPGIHETLYAPGVNYLPWTMKGRAWTEPLRRQEGRAGDPVLTYQGESREMLHEYLDSLCRLRVRVIVVAEPIRVYVDDPRAQWHNDFMKDLHELTTEKGLPLWDLSAVLPSEDFSTSSHFQPANHARFAEMLCERLCAELSPTELRKTPAPETDG